MKKLWCGLFILILSLTMFGCRNVDKEEEINYKLIIPVLFECAQKDELATQENKNTPNQITDIIKQNQESVKDQIGYLLTEDAQKMVFNETIGSLQAKISNFTFPISIEDMSIDFQDTDIVSIKFKDKEAKEGEVAFRIQMTDDKVNFIKIMIS